MLVINSWPFSVWCPLKVHTYLSKFTAERCRFVYVCRTSQWTPGTNGLHYPEIYHLSAFCVPYWILFDTVFSCPLCLSQSTFCYIPKWQKLFKTSTKLLCDANSLQKVLTMKLRQLEKSFFVLLLAILTN